MTDLPPDIFSPDARVVYFPVRHHSPTAARVVRDLIGSMQPAAVLIEGPSDFNDRLDELALPHELPVAIYSYVRIEPPAAGAGEAGRVGSGDESPPEVKRRGAYYPFCVYSPEWQAFLAGRAAGARVEFIDLPFADVAREDDHVNRYADADLRRGRYVGEVCRRLGLEGFDALWDTLIELEAGIDAGEYLRRVHSLCGHIRLLEGAGRASDRRREAFMARQVRRVLGECDPAGRVLVVTGGYHSVALYARLNPSGEFNLPGADDPADCEATPPKDAEERGIALTPYSYERLDSLRGYEAGMPNPGFYHRLWQDRGAAGGRPAGRRAPTHRHLLQAVTEMLRERKQRVSSADLIAAEACAAGLARLRGHGEVWRTDLVDGITAALLKDETSAAGRPGSHPLLDAIHEVLRGDERGALAAGTLLPPMVRDMNRQLIARRLLPEPKAREVELDLSAGRTNGESSGREVSRLLHRLRVLGIAGYRRVDGTDFTSREDLSQVWERWEIRWGPEFEASAVENSRYGPTVAEAAAARLAERAGAADRSAAEAAALLLEASLAGLAALAGDLYGRAGALIRRDPQFAGVAGALGHLLYLYHYDETLGTTGRPDVGALLAQAYARALWLLETLGQTADEAAEWVGGVRQIVETFDRCGRPLALDRGELLEVLGRVRGDRGQSPAVRGAAVGAAWRLGGADAAQALAAMRLFSDPDHLGDFLGGLFALAREFVQRSPDLILALDALLAGYGDEQFLTALPSLRLAFTYFTPREKHHLALNLREATGGKAGDAGGARAVPEKPLAALEVSPRDAARALAVEARLFATVKLYGLRGAEESTP